MTYQPKRWRSVHEVWSVQFATPQDGMSAAIVERRRANNLPAFFCNYCKKHSGKGETCSHIEAAELASFHGYLTDEDVD